MLLGKKRKWLEAKFGGNDRGFHLGANMSALQPAAAESTLRKLIVMVGHWWCQCTATTISVIVMLMQQVIRRLGANMSALQPAAAVSTLRSIEKADCGVSALPLSLIVMLMLVKMVIKAMQMMSECDSVGDGAGIADGDGDIGDTRNQSLGQYW